VRKMTGVMVGAALLIAGLVGMGSSAGAVDAASCSFSVVASSAGHVDITGSAPAGAFVKAFVGGNVNPAGTGSADGAFAIRGVPGSVTDTITVSYSANPESAYPTTSCTRVGNDVVVRVAPTSETPDASSTVSVAGASASSGATDPKAAAALAFTGSSGTSSLLLVGLAAFVAGLALVLGLRRRGARAE
jgi:LPXTG-motif cell wall-anchored protein